MPTQLFKTKNHELLNGTPWSPSLAKRIIEDIFESFKNDQQQNGSWPTHPRDNQSKEPLWQQWDGAAGAVVTLRILSAYGYGSTDTSSSLPLIHKNYLDSSKESSEPGLQLGETGIISPAVLAGVADRNMVNRLSSCMKKCADHSALDITSGAAGMMHAALTLFEATNNSLWADHYCAGVDSLLNTLETEPEEYAGLWRSEVFNGIGIPARHYYGACHGIAGNVGAILRGRYLLKSGCMDSLIEKTNMALTKGAVSNNGYCNWPVSVEPTKSHLLVQWCHGAPGVIVALGNTHHPDSDPLRKLDALLIQAGELIWKAGPVAKGSGVCHGTAGNGYAFLTLFRRTKESKWLDRARLFAMHAIGQYQRSKEHYCQSRYTLWTGDGGLAVYLHYCLAPNSETLIAPFPGLEVF